jgi:hypothetical protein
MCKICYDDVNNQVSKKDLIKKLKHVYMQYKCKTKYNIYIYINNIQFELTIYNEKDENNTQLYFNTMLDEDDILIAYNIDNMRAIMPFEYALKEIEYYLKNGCKAPRMGEVSNTNNVKWHCF